MEKKNIVFIAKSIDGFIAGKNGELDWLQSVPNPENNDMGYTDFMKEIDALVMGRNTFEMICSFDGQWPYDKHVFVLSNTIQEIPGKLLGKVTILNGSIKDVLIQIHNLDYHKLYIDGGRTVQNFLKEDLIDELRITTIPILLGGGIPLFDILPNSMSFRHIKTEVYLNQVVQTRYVRKV